MKALGKGSFASIVEVALTIAWILLWVALGLLALAAVSYGAILGLSAAGVIDPGDLAQAERALGNFGVRVSGVAVDALSPLEWTDWQIIVPGILAGFVAIGGSLVIVSRLRKLFESFRSAEPFRRENAIHLRVIWLTMVIVEVTRYALLILMVSQVGMLRDSKAASAASFSISSDSFSTWMSIAILIVLAEVFREGARMKEEQELTI
jgi:Protein of unknown function (DUF2975)